MGFGTSQIYRYANGVSVAVVANTRVGSNLQRTAAGVYRRVAEALGEGAIPFNYDFF